MLSQRRKMTSVQLSFSTMPQGCDNVNNDVVTTPQRCSASWAVSYLEPNGKNRPHEACSLPFGVAANIHEQKLCSTGKIVQRKPAVSLVDRKCNTEAYFFSFICENNLPIYLAPK